MELWREPSKSLGISIVGGRGMGSRLSNGEVMRGIFIKHVLEDSPAGKNGTLKPGDRIIEVTSSELSVQNILPLSFSYQRVAILALVLESGVFNVRHFLLFMCSFVCLWWQTACFMYYTWNTISKALVLRYINFKRNFLRGKLKCLISCIHKENTYLTVKFSSKMLLQGIIY